jgi:flavin reductase (DIM6/NTAB) family NADH-FMN oxidoreductase RutF
MIEHPDMVKGILHQIPTGIFVLSTAHDGHREGVIARWVQQCSIEPPMVMVAIPKGQPLEPVLLDSRAFTLNQVNPEDRYLIRKFSDPIVEDDGDLFAAISSITSPSGGPVVDRAMAYLDCRIVRHLELDGDHRVYIGQIVAAGVMNGSSAPLNGEA